VNEGVAEWPPSLWRILRALVAVWKRTRPDFTEERVKGILAKLSTAPHFHLPPATHSHTRHFMPWYKKGPEDRRLIFDTFVALDREAPVVAIWPGADLDATERQMLEGLLENLPFLGRAESWCRAKIDDGWESNGAQIERVDKATGEVFVADCSPLDEGELPPPGFLALPVLLAAEPLDLKALCVGTGEQRERRQDPFRPPGSRWVRYALRADAFSPGMVPQSSAVVMEKPTVARYSLYGTVLPLLTQTVHIAELARRSLMARYGRIYGGQTSPTLSGKAQDGTTLEGHGHTFYLPTDEDGDSRLDHLTLYARNGFDDREQAAIGELAMLNPGGGRPEICLVLLGLSCAQDFSVPVQKAARMWRSATPFLPSRHPKAYRDGRAKLRPSGIQVDGPEDQLRRELGLRDLPMPVSIERLDSCRLLGRQLRWLEFRRWRSKGRGPASGIGFGFSIRFPREIRGPLALGYGCHFGLGLFVPAEDTKE
jgi:CRISPR-associated protein Csb2